MREVDNILIGAGELYIAKFTGSEIPVNEEIETEANNVGHCSSGFEVSYKPSFKEVINQYGHLVKQFVESEEVTCKTGIMTWALDNLAMFSTGKINETSGKKTLTIGANQHVETLLVRFVHKKEDGKKLRFTMIGQAGNGFSMNFENKEITIDAEIKAVKKVKDFLCSFEEEIGE